jgi:hypothetical protein
VGLKLCQIREMKALTSVKIPTGRFVGDGGPKWEAFQLMVSDKKNGLTCALVEVCKSLKKSDF